MKSLIKTIAREVSKLSEEEEIIKLHVGEPNIRDTRLGERIKEKFREALSEAAKIEDLYKYPLSYGYEPLREILEKETWLKNGKALVSSSGGARYLLFVLFSVIKENYEGNIGIVQPNWEGHLSIAKTCGLEKRIKNFFTDPFEKEINIEIFEDFLKNENIKYLILTQPSNPTSTVFENTDEISKICKEYEVILIWDSAYKELCWRKKLEIKAEIEVGSFSKNFTPGVRTAYIIAEEDIIEKISAFVGEISTSSPYFEQHAISKIYREIKKLAEERRKVYKKRAELTEKILEEFEIDCPSPDAAFYIFPKIGEIDWRKLLYEYKVSAVPGYAFGGERYKNFYRISLVENEEKLEEGIKRIISAANS